MTLFVVSSWSACIATGLLLILVVLTQRFLLVKPSLVVVIFYHVEIQWAATVLAPEIELFLPRPWVFFVLAQLFPLLGLIGSAILGRATARGGWARLRGSPPAAAHSADRATGVLLLGVGLIAALYLREVPLSATGLYTILTDPLNSAQAREASLKLVENDGVRYLYSFLISALAPLLAVLLATQLLREWQRRRVLQLVGVGGLLLAVLATASLSGARGPAAFILLTILWAAFLRRGMPINPVHLAAAVLLTLSLPTIVSILREGQPLTLDNFWYYLTTGGIFDRVFVAPMQTGLWHVHYSQTNGFFGVAAVPRLAALAGVEPVNVANLIYLTYYSSWPPSGLAVTGYVFSYYSYFGLLTFPFSLAGLWLLDAALWLYRRLGSNLLPPTVATISVISTNFAAADYTIVLLTNGFLVALATAWVLDWLGRLRFTGGWQKSGRRRASPSAWRVREEKP